jgi:hypothetical protein
MVTSNMKAYIKNIMNTEWGDFSTDYLRQAMERVASEAREEAIKNCHDQFLTCADNSFWFYLLNEKK